MSKKMGRPLSDEPRKHLVGCKLTDKELQRLDEYCKDNSVSKSDVLKSGIQPIINPSSESK